MASPALLEFDPLLAPLPGDKPAGNPLPLDVREALELARKEIDPEMFRPDDPRRPELKRADWEGIVRLAQETLTRTSKDLQVAARLTEALAKLHGFAGARDGFQLLRRMVAECWDRLNPSVEDGDVEVRAGPFNWLDDPNRGAIFPLTLRAVPLVAAEGTAYSWQHWRKSQDQGPGQAQAVAFEKAVVATPRAQCQAIVDDLAAALEELGRLGEALDQKMGAVAPDMLAVREALTDCQVLAQQILERKGPAPAAPAEQAPEQAASANGPAPAAPAAPRGLTRADIYAQLSEVAGKLKEMEPHSPIPYLIERAIALGAMPFPLLMRALIRDENILIEMNRELGIKDVPPA
jgi:type VI secretion system protein ImpA